MCNLHVSLKPYSTRSMKLNYTYKGEVLIFWCRGFTHKVPRTQDLETIAHYQQLGYELVERSPNDAPVDSELPKVHAPRPPRGACQLIAVAQ